MEQAMGGVPSAANRSALHSASSRLLTLPLQPSESQRAKRGPSITGTLKGLRLLYAVSSRCFS